MGTVIHTAIRKGSLRLLRLFLFCCLSGLLSYPLQAQYTPQNDIITPKSPQNSGRFLFSSLWKATDTTEADILPKIIYPYIPITDYLNKIGTGTGGDAPNMGVVEGTVLTIAQAFKTKGTAGTSGQSFWTLTYTFIALVLLLNGMMTGIAISQGRKEFGKSGFNFVFKATFSIFLVTAVCPNIPTTLIAFTNYTTQGLSNWYYQTKNKADNANLLKNIYEQKANIGIQQSAAIVDVVMRILTDRYAESQPAIIKQFSEAILNDPQIQSYWSQALKDKELKDLESGMKSEKFKGWEEINDEIARLASKRPSDTLVLCKRHLESILKGQTGDQKAEQEILEYILKGPQNLDLTSTGTPSKIIKANAYITFVYLSLSIWGAGFASCVWVLLFACPEDWNFNGILYTGLKTLIGIVLTGSLVAVYISASFMHTNVTNSTTNEVVSHFLESLVTPAQGTLSFWDTGIIPKIKQAVGGHTLDQVILGLLILTAPAQAAGMIQGGNAIADKAKEAMNASGASGTGIGGLVGENKGTSGASLNNGSNLANTLSRTNMSQKFGPSDPN